MCCTASWSWLLAKAVVSAYYGNYTHMLPCPHPPQVYVLKVINMDMGNQQVRRQVTREVRALDGARHPHVVSYHQSFFAEGAVTILMEFMDGGTLWDLLQKVRA
jgi:mitogen-activated protein kinase kinase 1